MFELYRQIKSHAAAKMNQNQTRLNTTHDIQPIASASRTVIKSIYIPGIFRLSSVYVPG
ncbi:hypothetical protein CHU_1049 [Cytophaga hutchinsonii ATCC 33406]|uniref:Uncharacterized protein n=1 Tax=Cytophaga hutchinsonii (strain ATCC 33406 / DSM 1761 / CIP 103989 / NBRC 15051 / NCIMB 9469 / D465) TaxID=269798 RepID=A0A6N4SPY6_CYTH3|nr:hypothetical protein CHU_1049 [Cytophaga hutchinsonii ATCC 33406]